MNLGSICVFTSRQIRVNRSSSKASHLLFPDLLNYFHSPKSGYLTRLITYLCIHIHVKLTTVEIK